jgi:hypothetical protein
LSGSWPNESMQAKQFATFRQPQQKAARAGLRPRRVRCLDAGLSRSRRAARSLVLAGFLARFLAEGGKPIHTINRALRRKILYMFRSSGPVAQGIEQQPSKLKVAGSNPAGVANKISGFLHLRPMISALKIAWGGMGAERKWPA